MYVIVLKGFLEDVGTLCVSLINCHLYAYTGYETADRSIILAPCVLMSI